MISMSSQRLNDDFALKINILPIGITNLKLRTTSSKGCNEQRMPDNKHVSRVEKELHRISIRNQWRMGNPMGMKLIIATHCYITLSRLIDWN